METFLEIKVKLSIEAVLNLNIPKDSISRSILFIIKINVDFNSFDNNNITLGI